MNTLTDRQQLVLLAALLYAHANVDDLNDALKCHPDEGDPDAQIAVVGEVTAYVTGDDLVAVGEAFGTTIAD